MPVFPDEEIESDIRRMIEFHIPEWKRESARAWLEARVEAFKSLERLT